MTPNNDLAFALADEANAMLDPITAELDREEIAQRTWEELPEDEYHPRPEWSMSQLKLVIDEPELFYGRHILKIPDWQLEPSKYMNLGTATHGQVLCDKPPTVIPRDVLTSNGQRRGGNWERWKADHAGETIIKYEELDAVNAMVESIRSTPKAKALLDLPGKPEHSLFWRDSTTGLNLRGRLDKLVLLDNSAMIVDLKCTNNASPEKFPWTALDHGYHYQAAAYMWAVREVLDLEPTAFVFVVVEYQPPFRCFVYEAADEMLDFGWIRLKESLVNLKGRLASGNWTREDRNRILRLTLPKSAKFQAN